MMNIIDGLRLSDETPTGAQDFSDQVGIMASRYTPCSLWCGDIC